MSTRGLKISNALQSRKKRPQTPIKLTQNSEHQPSRAFELSQIEHLRMEHIQIDRGLCDLGQPWLTFITDLYSGLILSHFLTYAPPTYISCMLALRECVRKHNRLPKNIIVDNASEFNNISFDILLNIYGCKKMFKSMITRGLTNSSEMIAMLSKTSYSSITQLHNIIEQFEFKLLPDTNGVHHSDNVFSIKYDDEFIIHTMPFAEKVKVSGKNKISINTLTYACEGVSILSNNLTFKVKIDPLDISIAYAYLNERWVQCTLIPGQIAMGVTKKLP